MTDTWQNSPAVSYPPTSPLAPPDAAPAAPAGPAPSPADRAISGIEGLMGSQSRDFADEQSALAPRYGALQHSLEQPIPQAPAQQKVADAPKPEDFQKYSVAFAGAMAVLGAVASKYTRVSGTAALSAFAGAVKGWQQGNLQAYESHAKEWEENTKKTVENNKQVMDAYKQALENRKLNIDQQMSEIQLISAQYKDKMMFDAATSKNYTMVGQLYMKQQEYTDKVAQSAEKLQQQRDQQTQKNEQSAAWWLSPSGQARLALPPGQPGALDDAQRKGVQQLIQVYGSRSVKGGQIGQLVEKENAEREERGEPPMTAQEEIQFSQSVHPPRSAPAMAVEAFKRDYQEKNGKQPSADEIAHFASDYSRQQSYGRTAGSQGARVESAANEVVQLIPQAVEASRKLPRGNFVPINTLTQRYEQGTSDPAYNDFLMANFSLLNAYTRAMNPQGTPRIQERLEQHALGVLSTATSPEAYEVQVRRLWKEVQASKTATAKTAEGVTPGDINSPVPGLDVPTGGEGAPLPPGNYNWTPDKGIH